MPGVRRIPALVRVLGAVLWTAQGAGAAAVKPPIEQIELRLYGALAPDGPARGDPSSLILLARRTEDGWGHAWGTAREINHNVHMARIMRAERTDQRLAMTFDLEFLPDARGSRGGVGRFQLELARQGDSRYRGRYRGQWRGVETEGDASATMLPAPAPLPPDFTPPARGEHPRILFRAADLPALRRKAATPLGQAALDKLDGPVGLALKYRLTGDRAMAQQAMPLIEQLMARGLMSDQFGNNVGDRLEKTAIAYDLCFDAWPEAFKRRVRAYLLWAGEGMLRARRDTHQAVNWHVCSNWSSPLYTGAAFAGLALWGHAGPPPARPMETAAGVRVAPAEDYRPPAGTPVSDLVGDAMPPEWIAATGFPTETIEGDPLADLGGARHARPGPVDTVCFGGKTIAFVPLSHEPDKGYWSHANYDDGKKLIDITNASGRVYFTTNFFYTVVRNDTPRWVCFEPGMHRAVLHLAGVRVAPGDPVHIAPGLYPMLVETFIDQINPWGRQLMRPRLVDITEGEARSRTERQRAEFVRQEALWRQRLEEWERLGGLDLRYRDLFERSRYMMYAFCREAVGDGGFTSELAHYGAIAERPPARYIFAHRRMFGYDVSPRPDMTHLLPRKMFCHIYPEDGRPWAQEINGSPQASGGLFAALWPVVPAPWRPAALWAWRRHAGAESGGWEALVADDPLMAFLNTPLDADPEPPAGRMPCAWHATDFGFHGFRNRWRDGDDFLLQVFARAHHMGGWNAPNAGTFRLAGLGHVWADGPTDRHRHRWEESVVQLPDDAGIILGACGRVTHVESRPDGSGVVSIDLGDVYARRALMPDGRGRRLYERYGNLRIDDAFIESGMTGMRSIGVDFSGRCGSPCLVAIVDRIDGGGRKVWTWQLPLGGKDASGGVGHARTDGDTFTIEKHDGAALHGRMITGQRPEVEVRATTMVGGAGSQAGKVLERPIHGVFAESADRRAAFFFVGTIQRGAPPRIEVSGRGLDAEVRVGRQRVRFDGEKVVFDAVQ